MRPRRNLMELAFDLPADFIVGPDSEYWQFLCIELRHAAIRQCVINLRSNNQNAVVLEEHFSELLLNRSLNEWRSVADELRKAIPVSYFVEPCSRCFERTMILERVSPNGVSISYRCANCSKSNTVPAATDDIYDVVDNWQTCECLQEEFVTFHQSLCLSHFCEEFSGVNDGEFDPILDQVRKDWNAAEIEATTITFETHAPKMSYETKVREHISAELRRRIWVRDGGICVECSSPNNLQFDHVIPVSKGGATSEDNLQLLCQTCNLRKSNRI